MRDDQSVTVDVTAFHPLRIYSTFFKNPFSSVVDLALQQPTCERCCYVRDFFFLSVTLGPK